MTETSTTCSGCAQALTTTAHVVRRLQRARRQNQYLRASLDTVTAERDTYRDEVRTLNASIRRLKEPAA